MKKKLSITVTALYMLLFIPCLASAAPNCPLWLGTWEVKYADNSTRIWKIYEADNDTGSAYILCEALGYSETPAGTDQILFKIIYMTFTNTYSYTEATEFSSSMPSREMDVNAAGDNFTSQAGGQYPVESGIKTSSVVPPPPIITTTTTTTTTPVTCALEIFPESIHSRRLGRLGMFIVSEGDDAEFERGTRVDWGTDDINTILQFRLPRRIFSLAWIQANAAIGKYQVTVGDDNCTGTLEIK
jgi:hypothetical protein